MNWIHWSLLSAFFAGVTAVLAKAGADDPAQPAGVSFEYVFFNSSCSTTASWSVVTTSSGSVRRGASSAAARSAVGGYDVVLTIDRAIQHHAERVEAHEAPPGVEGVWRIAPHGFDQVAGQGWVLLGYDADPSDALTQAQRRQFAALDIVDK